MLQINFWYPHGNQIPNRNDLTWVVNEALTHLRDMDKSILMDTDIHKGTKVHNISDSPFKFLSDWQVFEFKNILTKYWCFKIITEVTTWLQKVSDDIFKGFLSKH